MEDNELETTRVPRALEMKSKLFGFELPDLLLIFMNLAVTNLIFGASHFRYTMVWGTTLSLASFLFFAKRGKPENYIQHLGEYHFKPGHYTANAPDLKYKNFKSESGEKNNVKS